MFQSSYQINSFSIRTASAEDAEAIALLKKMSDKEKNARHPLTPASLKKLNTHALAKHIANDFNDPSNHFFLAEILPSENNILPMHKGKIPVGCCMFKIDLDQDNPGDSTFDLRDFHAITSSYDPKPPAVLTRLTLMKFTIEQAMQNNASSIVTITNDKVDKMFFQNEILCQDRQIKNEDKAMPLLTGFGQMELPLYRGRLTLEKIQRRMMELNFNSN